MNSRTTLILAIVCVALGGAWFIARNQPKPAALPKVAAPDFSGDRLTKNVVGEDAKIGAVARVQIEQTGHDTIVFEKDEPKEGAVAGQATWRMTEPMQIPVRSWEAEGFGRTINDLKYQISFAPGDAGGVSSADAGLDPPDTSITVGDEEGKSVTLEVGKRKTAEERYVRLAGDDRIYVATSDPLRSLKSSAVEYRDQALWNFAPENVTRVEITEQGGDDGPVDYAFVKEGDQWMMASPVSARATAKVGEMVTAISRLRASKWETDAGDRLGAYGLAPAATTVKVTVESQVPVDSDEAVDEGDGEESEPKPVEMKTETKTYVLHLSNRSPIGEDTKTYVSVADETMVAVVMKTTADKLRPVMAEWRDMSITSVDVDSASRIALDVEGAQATLTKGEAGWSFEGDGGKAEQSQVAELLGAIRSLRAVVFVEATESELDGMGLGSPRATIRLTIPAVEGGERISVGNYTDGQAKRMVYVRRGDSMSIAKVRTGDVDTLLKRPLLYRDRTINAVDPSSIAGLTLDREEDGRAVHLEFGQTDGAWQMTSPVKAQADQTKVGELVSTLAALKGRSVVAEAGEETAYGLHSPMVTAELKVSGGDGDEPRAIGILATEHDGNYYAKRMDRSTIYQTDREVYDRLTGELRDAQLCAHSADEFVGFSIATSDGKTEGFTHSGDKWTYDGEPDLPLDQVKVGELVAKMAGLTATRFVRHKASGSGELGLGSPDLTIKAGFADGSSWDLAAFHGPESSGGVDGYYATSSAWPGVALLAGSSVDSLRVDVAKLEAK